MPNPRLNAERDKALRPTGACFEVEGMTCTTFEDALWAAGLREVRVTMTEAQVEALDEACGFEGNELEAWPSLNRKARSLSCGCGDALAIAECVEREADNIECDPLCRVDADASEEQIEARGRQAARAPKTLAAKLRAGVARLERARLAGAMLTRVNVKRVPRVR